jgi:hypothetical protein
LAVLFVKIKEKTYDKNAKNLVRDILGNVYSAGGTVEPGWEFSG